MTDLRALLAPIRARRIAACDYPGPVTIEESQRDVEGLLAAIEAVESWCMNLDAIEAAGPSSVGNLNASARAVANVIRKSVAAALGSDTTNQEGTQ